MRILQVIVLLLACGSVRGQLSPLEILRKSAAAMKELRSIQYTFYAEQDKEKINGEVKINRVRPFPVFEISQVNFTAVSISDEGPSQILFASDGSMFEYMDRKLGKVITIDSPTISGIMQSGMMRYAMLPLPCFLQAEPFSRMIGNLESAVVAGDTSIYKISSYKLKVRTRAADGAHYEVDWYIGKDDFLVRGMSSASLKQFINIEATNHAFAAGEFTLSTRNVSLKRTDGNDPLSEGLLKLGSSAPTWKLPSNKSTIIDLSELKGKVVLLDFWGTWCMPCIKAMPEIQEIHEHFKGRPVEVIGVSVEMKKSGDPAGFVKAKGYTYTIALNGQEITRKYQVLTYPTVYLIDKNGKIVHAEHSGGRENFKADIIQRIEDILKN